MHKYKVSLGTPYRWLGEGFALCRAHPATFLGAASVMLVVSLLPALLNRLAASLLPDSLAVQGLIYIVFSLLLLPPIVGGFYRLAHATHRGEPVSARDVFAVLGDGPAVRRLVLTNLLFFFLLLLGVVVPVVALGGEELRSFLHALVSLERDATELPAMPEGLAPLLIGAALVGLLINTAKSLAMVQASLVERAPLQATGDGFRVALRNAAAFLLFYLPVAALAFVGFMVFALVAVLVGRRAQPAQPGAGLPGDHAGRGAGRTGRTTRSPSRSSTTPGAQTLADDDTPVLPSAGGEHQIEV